MTPGKRLPAIVLSCAVLSTLAWAGTAEADGPDDVEVDVIGPDSVKVTFTDRDTNETGWTVDAYFCPLFCELLDSHGITDHRAGQPQSTGRTVWTVFLNLDLPEEGRYCFFVTSHLPNGTVSEEACVELPPECFPGDCRMCGSGMVQTCNANNTWNGCHTGVCP